MRAYNKNGLQFYRFRHLANCQGVGHAIFSRQGGISLAPYKSLNVSYGLGDRSEAVGNNRRRILQTVGGNAMAFLHQVHGNRVVVAKNVAAGDAPAIEVADALISTQSGLMLMIQVADCQAILIYDPVQRIVANVHSGWRGSVADIPGQTVRTLVREFNCRPTDLLAGIGPSLGPCCAEFVNYRREIPKSYWHYKDEHDHFDFWAITRDQLIDAGVLESRIEVSGTCTRCHTDRFFSHRAEYITGRFAAVIGLV